MYIVVFLLGLFYPYVSFSGEKYIHVIGFAKHGKDKIKFRGNRKFNEINFNIGIEENYETKTRFNNVFLVKAKHIDLMQDSFYNTMLGIGVYYGIGNNFNKIKIDYGIESSLWYRSIKMLAEDGYYSKKNYYMTVPYVGLKIGITYNKKIGINFLYSPRITLKRAKTPRVAFFQLKYNIN